MPRTETVAFFRLSLLVAKFHSIEKNPTLFRGAIPNAHAYSLETASKIGRRVSGEAAEKQFQSD
jgi:hypothetical protein